MMGSRIKNSRMSGHGWVAGACLLCALVLVGCRGGEETERRVMLDRLNGSVVDSLIEEVLQRGGSDFEALKFDRITATQFLSPATVRIAGERQSQKGTKGAKVAGSYDLACSVDHGIVRARVVATTLPGVDLPSGESHTGSVSRFEEAVSRALTTDAMSGVADAGIKSVVVENNALLIEAVTPMW